ncbi:MAG: 30S ribosomal protein S17 [Deltaproteobacteria bacterium]|nr:30S ribosomal protein S17 [Deltaproteobacteria bacterium]
MAEENTIKRGQPKFRQGIVVSDKMNKSVVVAVTSREKHPVYGKFVKRTKKYMAHDENDECRNGDTVKIVETRPLSKIKRWKVQEIVERAV